MANLAEVQITALENQGYTTGSINERTWQWLFDQVGQTGTLNELWHLLLNSLGYTTGTLQEKQIQSWLDLGYGPGSYNELRYEFWAGGGAYGPTVRIEPQGEVPTVGFCKYAPAGTCTSQRQYTANDSNFTEPVNQWVWSIESGDAEITAGQGTNTVTVRTPSVLTGQADADVAFQLKVIASNDFTPISPEAQAVLNRMSALTQPETDAIVAFVDGCVTDGNWAKIDEFFCFALNSTDWLTGWKAQTATAGAGVSRGANGAVFTAAAGAHIETGVQLPLATQFTLNDGEVGIYAHTVADWGAVNADFCGVEDGTTNRTRIRHRGNDTNDFRTSINQSASFDNDEILPISKKLFSLVAGAADAKFYADAVEGVIAGAAPAAVPAGFDVWIGSANSNGSESSTPVASTFTSFYVGATLADRAAFLTRLNTLHTALGVT